MNGLLRTLDMWRSAIIRAPANALQQSDLTAEKLRWIPGLNDRFTFRADPFGIWRQDQLHVFVERFDYRTLKGEIEVLIFDSELEFVGSRLVLQKPWHLSYPFVFEHDCAIWMLPEANRSGQLVLYRASSFPFNWDAEITLDVPGEAVDATPFRHEGRWWLLYGIVDRGGKRSCSLNLAYADALTAPWKPHPRNPVRLGLAGTRPAGTPLIAPDGAIHIPVQDASRTYGGAVRRLSVTRLDETGFEAEDSPWLSPSPALSPFADGIHTISAVGDISLIDCKFVDRSISGTVAWRRGRSARRERQRAGAEVPPG